MIKRKINFLAKLIFYQMHNISRDINDSLKYDIVALDVLENTLNFLQILQKE